jgi:hypothetical protein
MQSHKCFLFLMLSRRVVRALAGVVGDGWQSFSLSHLSLCNRAIVAFGVSRLPADDVLWKQQGVTSVANGSCPLFQNLHSPRDCGTADRAGSRPTWTLPGCGGVFSVRCWWRPPWPRRRMTTTPSRPAFSQVSHRRLPTPKNVIPPTQSSTLVNLTLVGRC